ncbi:outer membrane receptor protein [Paenibacillus popilliae ATCC 14706]|uniref:Outer membrane receptor protein n=2 Tax=Paenibacillus popilliae TaxID=78057 RepID=M9LF39_PAEPP|nr:outer membrane receptor protein [Paenibacillus popilliae ATCC 14706]
MITIIIANDVHIKFRVEPGWNDDYCTAGHDGGAVCRGWEMPLFVSEAGPENKKVSGGKLIIAC